MKTKIGLYSCGNRPYWGQFEGLKDRLTAYGKFIGEKMSNLADVEICNFGLVDSFEAGTKAGEYFNREGVSLIFCHVATYSPSSNVLPVHKTCRAETIVLNLQPCAKINYAKTDTGEWLAHCIACAVPEICNALARCSVGYTVINGLLGQTETPACSLADERTADRAEAVAAWREIAEWLRAADAVAKLKGSRFGFLGNYYEGMLDMYSDFTLLSSAFGIDIRILEMCDIKRSLDRVTEAETAEKLKEIRSLFEIGGDSEAAAEARRPTPEQLTWSARVACAQQRTVEEFKLDALAYYYHGADGGEYERIQSGFIVGHSLLTAKHVPCAGEADIKTGIAMKLCDLLGVGGSFCEIVTSDYEQGTILVGHDGPFHIRIAEGAPLLRGMGVYHGKRGTGVSVEAKVKRGEVSTLGIAQTADGRVRMIISEGTATDGEIMRIGNTQTHVRFSLPPDAYMDEWFRAAPTHHFALSIGRNARLFVKLAKLLDIESVVIG